MGLERHMNSGTAGDPGVGARRGSGEMGREAAPVPTIGPGVRDSPMKRGAIAATLAALTVLALILRLIGIGFGLPAVYNPDEISILSRALAFSNGDLNPHNFLYPTLFFYILFGWIVAAYAFGRLAGVFGSLAAFQYEFFVDPTRIYLAGRLLGAIAGTLTIPATYLLATRLVGRRAGLAAATFVAVAPLHVRDSQYIKHDVPATLAIVVAVLAISRIVPGLDPARGDVAASPDPRVRRRCVLIASVACAVAMSIHYYAVFLAIPLVIAIWSAHRARERRGALLRALAAGAVTFVACSPFLVVEPVTAWTDITANRAIVVDRAVRQAGGVFASAAYYGRTIVVGCGWPVALLSVVGIAAMFRSRRYAAVLVLSFVMPFLLFISNTVPAARYVNPVVPFVAMAAGYGVQQIVGHGMRRQVPAVGILLVALAALPPLVESVRTGIFFRRTDTRTLAQQHIESTVPEGATVLVQPYTVQLTQSRNSLEEALERRLGSVDRASRKFAARLALDPYPRPGYRTLYLGDGGLDADKIYVGYGELGGAGGLTRLRELGVQFVVVRRYNTDEQLVRRFREALERDADRVAVFSPYAGGADPDRYARVEPFLHNTDAWIHPALARPGPVVEIWRLNGS